MQTLKERKEISIKERETIVRSINQFRRATVREFIFNILKQSFRAAHLEKVRLEETMMNSFEYAGGAELRV